MQFFAIKLGWFPVSGRVAPGGGGFVDRFVHFVLPVATMTLAMCAVLMRYARNTMLDAVSYTHLDVYKRQ